MTTSETYTTKVYQSDYDVAQEEAVREAVLVGLTRPKIIDATWTPSGGYWRFKMEQANALEEVT